MNHCRFGSTSIVTGFFAMLTMMFIASANAQDRNRGTTTLPRFHRIDARTVAGMQELFHATQQPLPFVSAHRGGPQKDFPENCIATFENTLVHTFAILEIDPRYAGDGTIVVHHDSTLDRTTTGNGAIAKFSLPALKQLRLKDTQGNVTEYQIPTLDEVLEWAKGKTIVVLDQKVQERLNYNRLGQCFPTPAPYGALK